jgi:hypothetical protein
MAECRWKQFKTPHTHPSFQQTQVRFCPCDACHAARSAFEAARGLPTFRPAARIKERFDVLRWVPQAKPAPELPTPEAAGDGT